MFTFWHPEICCSLTDSMFGRRVGQSVCSKMTSHCHRKENMMQVLFPGSRINGLSATFGWRRHSAQEAAAGWSAGTTAAPQEGTGHHRGQPCTTYTALPRTKSHIMVHRSSQSRWIITISPSPFWKLSGRFSMTLGSSQLWSPWWGFCPQQGRMAFFSTTKLRGRQGCSPIRSVLDRPPTCEPM